MERELYPLTAAQNILFYSQKYSFQKQINNVATLLLIEEDIDIEIFKSALLKSYERIDALRLRITKHEGSVMQYFLDKEQPEMHYLNLSGKNPEEVDAVFNKLASKRVTHFDKPLSRVFFLENCNGMKGIFFIVSHLILDSWGICNFFKDVMSVYEAMAKGGEYPKAPYAYKDLMLQELNYRNTPQYIKDREYWINEFSPTNEPIFTHLNGSKVLDKVRKKKKNPLYRRATSLSFLSFASQEILLIPKDMVDKMKLFCSEHRLPVQTLIMLAYRSFISKINRREKDILFYTVLARRGTLAEKSSGGSRVYFLPFRTILDESTTFKDSLEMLAEKQSSIYKHSAINPLENMGIITKAYNKKPTEAYASGSLTFQPIPIVHPNGAKIHSKWYCNGASSNYFYMTVMDDDGSGALRFYYEYKKTIVSVESIRELHSYMLKFIETGLNNKDITIGELLSLE